jgi:hypothetical protein
MCQVGGQPRRQLGIDRGEDVARSEGPMLECKLYEPERLAVQSNEHTGTFATNAAGTGRRADVGESCREFDLRNPCPRFFSLWRSPPAQGCDQHRQARGGHEVRQDLGPPDAKPQHRLGEHGRDAEARSDRQARLDALPCAERDQERGSRRQAQQREHRRQAERAWSTSSHERRRQQARRRGSRDESSVRARSHVDSGTPSRPSPSRLAHRAQRACRVGGRAEPHTQAAGTVELVSHPVRHRSQQLDAPRTGDHLLRERCTQSRTASKRVPADA